jgi:hypoxanthine phosphoribosyltransferase
MRLGVESVAQRNLLAMQMCIETIFKADFDLFGLKWPKVQNFTCNIMSEADHSNYIVKDLISAKAIAARIEAMAAEIELVFSDSKQLVVVGLLRGSFMFISDLVRELNLPVEVDFIETSSYGDSTESSREVRILKDLRGEINGRDVLVVEDIVDTGHTLQHVIKLLNSRDPAKLLVCALLDKPARREVDIKADLVGFEIPDEFVVGYGIDYAQRNRNLPYIGTVQFLDK